MATTLIPQPPEGFVLDSEQGVPAPPEGFVIDSPQGIPAPPEGFVLDQQAPKKLSLLSTFARSFMKFAPLEQLNTKQAELDQYAGISPQDTAETRQAKYTAYFKRAAKEGPEADTPQKISEVNAAMGAREKGIISGGTAAQFGDLMTVGAGAGMASAPGATAKMLAIFMGLEKGADVAGINKAIQNIPNATASDVIDLVKIGVEGIFAGGLTKLEPGKWFKKGKPTEDLLAHAHEAMDAKAEPPPPPDGFVIDQPQTDLGRQLKDQIVAKGSVPLHPAEAGREALAKIYPPEVVDIAKKVLNDSIEKEFSPDLLPPPPGGFVLDKPKKTKPVVNKPITVLQRVRQIGIDPEKAKIAGYPFKTFKEFGFFGVLRKGAPGPDDVALTLHNEGAVIFPEGKPSADHLIEILKDSKRRAQLIIRDMEKQVGNTDWDAEHAKWLEKNKEDPNGLTPDEIRRAEEDIANEKIKEEGGGVEEAPVNPLDFQDKNQENIIHSEWQAASPRYDLEGAGDIFRELAKEKFQDYGYISSKMKRVENFIEDHLSRKIHPDDSIENAIIKDTDKVNKLLDFWKKQPTVTPEQELAKKLNIALLENDMKGAKGFLEEIKNLQQTPDFKLVLPKQKTPQDFIDQAKIQQQFFPLDISQSEKVGKQEQLGLGRVDEDIALAEQLRKYDPSLTMEEAIKTAQMSQDIEVQQRLSEAGITEPMAKVPQHLIDRAKALVKPKKWWQEAYDKEGLRTKGTPFVEADLQNQSVRDAIAGDPSLTQAQKDKLLGPPLSGESGQIKIKMLPLVGEAKEAFDTVKQAHSDIIKATIPAKVSPPAEFAAGTVREAAGLMARSNDRAAAALETARKVFEKSSKEENYVFIDRAEHGAAHENPLHDETAKIWREISDSDVKDVQDLGTGKLEEWIRNYFPHLWKDPKKAEAVFSEMAKRPIEGSKSFLKKRTLPTFKEGIDRGLEPVSDNPIDLMLMKHAEVQKYVMAHRVLNSGKEAEYVKAIMIGKERPEGWVKINDNISVIYGNPMVPLKEAFDANVMDRLNQVAKNLDIEHLRKVKIGGKRWGYAERSGDRVVTKFAGDPTMVLAHELGHAIDFKYGLQELMFGGSRPYADFIMDKMIGKAQKEGRLDDVARMQEQKVRNKELRDLADQRQQRPAYARKGTEKMAVVMEAYIHAPELFKRVAPETFKFFENFLKSHDELKPFLEIKPSVVLGEGHGEVYAGGLVIAGNYYAHPDFARVVNNYLSPGLQGKLAFDLYRSAGNAVVQTRLSLSAFHAAFIANDMNISSFAMGMHRLSIGNVLGAFKDVVMAGAGPIHPIMTILEGRKMNEAWYGKDKGELINRIAEVFARANGSPHQNKFWAIQSDKAIGKALEEGKYLKGALEVPFWILRQINRPLMEYGVPRAKMGVFANIMKFEIEKNPNITDEELLVLARKAVDTVDYRLGQMNYENLFLNKVLKDVGMSSVQSFGWNVGDIGLAVGGANEAVGLLKGFATGKPTALGYNLAYILAMPIVMGYYGAIYQYLHTGKRPGEGLEEEGARGVVKDLFFPRNGGVDRHGEEARVNLPSYVKDAFHFKKDPVRTIVNKLNPIWSTLIQMLQNKDYYGNKIHNEDDPRVRQFLDNAGFWVRANEPYSVQNLQRETRPGIEAKIENFFGVTPAPYNINASKAEEKAAEISRGKVPAGARGKEQAAASQEKSNVRAEYMATKKTSVLGQAIREGRVSRSDATRIMKESKKEPLVRRVANFSAEEVASVIKSATPEEQKQLKRIFLQKFHNKMKNRAKLTTKEIERLRKLRDEVMNPPPEESKPWVDLSVFSNLIGGSTPRSPNADFSNLIGTQPKKRFSIAQ